MSASRSHQGRTSVGRDLVLGETPPRLAAFGDALCLSGVYVARRA